MAGRILFLLFTLVPLAEIAGFVLVGQAIGLWPTLLGVVVMALLGAALIRWQGFAVLGKMRSALDENRLPGRELADAMLIGLAGLLLLLPGFVSDVFGLLLLIPAVRTLIYRGAAARMGVAMGPSSPRGSRRIDGVVDLEVEEWREK